jgi:O-succinylbenzoic acid--CoA ligase
MDKLVERLIASLPDLIEPSVPDVPRMLIDCDDPLAFWSQFMGALEKDVPIVLMDPSWPAAWKSHIEELLKHAPPEKGQILIPTSGSSGTPKLCIHDSHTLGCAAMAFAKRFQSAGIIHSVNVLPQHHVGGLMPVWRSAASGGKSVFANYRDPDFTRTTGLPLEECSLSLVPTQLGRLLQSSGAVDQLKKFGLVLTGGSACPPGILEKARHEGIRLAPCYGMSESAAMVTLLDPEAFLEGEAGVGKALPGMSVTIGDGGCIEILSGSIQRGYHGVNAPFQREPLVTNDVGRMDSSGSLHVLGRSDRVINTGGEKVHPEQVEAAALSTGLVDGAQCRGIPDPDWGMRIELTIHPAKGVADPTASLLTALRELLPPYAIPKSILMDDLPDQNEMGKSRPGAE